jgi:hypothetical protein
MVSFASAVMIGLPAALGQPTAIHNADDLNTLPRLNPGGDFVLADNINLSGFTDWQPIGDATTPFTGTFDGGEFVISNLNIDRSLCCDDPENPCVCDGLGLFGVANGAVFTNVTIENIHVLGRNEVGGLLGSAIKCTVLGCYVRPPQSGTSYVRGQQDVGGMIGRTEGLVENGQMQFTTVEQCSSGVNAYAGDRWGGGLVGHTHVGSIIRTSHAWGTITGLHGIGGLAGNVHGSTVEDSSASGTVRASSVCGGLVGFVQFDQFSQPSIQNKILRSSASGNVTSTGQAGFYEPPLAAPTTGGLIAWVDGNSLIEDCDAIGQVTAPTSVVNPDITNSGGLIGQAQEGSTVRGCVATGNVVYGTTAGGLMGWGFGAVENCWAFGNVNGQWQIGGLVGAAEHMSIKDSHAYGAVTAGGITPNSNSVHFESGHLAAASGGLIGYTFPPNTQMVVSRCSAHGNVTAQGQYVGGLVGLLWGTVLTESYATGDVFGNDRRLGGLVGGVVEQSGTAGQTSTISNCYATGDVTSSATQTAYRGQVAGLVGLLKRAIAPNQVKYCYSTGYVTLPCDDGRGLIGERSVGSPASSVYRCYWDRITSDHTCSDGGESRITEEMQQSSNYIEWDFTNVWNISAGTYPFLRNNP